MSALEALVCCLKRAQATHIFLLDYD